MINKNLDLSEKHLEIVKSILSKYPYTFYAFGSRTTGKARRFSDLDICFFESIPGNIIFHIQDDFIESDLPFKVDLVNWNTSNKNFRDSVISDLFYLQGDRKLGEKLFAE